MRLTLLLAASPLLVSCSVGATAPEGKKPAASAPAAASTTSAAPAAASAPAAAVAAPAPGMTPQPPGPAPEGKVWAPEHGHWHDIPGATPTVLPGAPGSEAMPLTITPQPGALTPGPQPPGPAPEGKVWSPEHGHWHDIPGAAPTAMPMPAAPGSEASPITIQPQMQPLTPGPQPAGPAPEGKVWSEEHGHWHDAPGAAPQGLQLVPTEPGAPAITPLPAGAPATPVPQPEGPVPPGKVWSAEHGHWHDVPPAGGAVLTPVPAPAPKPAEPKKNP